MQFPDREPKLTRRFFIALAVMLLAVITIAIIGWQMWSADSQGKPSQTDTRGTLRYPYKVAWGGKESLNPTSPTRFMEAISILYDRLVSLDDEGKVTPELALSWQSNEEASIWTFKLRQGVKFHNGKELTATDVAYTMNHILSDTQSPIASTLRVLKSVEVRDSYTVVFNLEQGHADFPILLSDYRVGIISENSLNTIEQTGNGTGAFKLRKLDAEGQSVFVANDSYWKGQPGLIAIEIIAIADPEARLQALLANQIDVMQIPPQQASLFVDKPEFITRDVPTGDWRGIVMRTDLPPFNDVRVRRALRLAADRQQMLDLILQRKGTLACDNPVWTGDQYHLKLDCPQDIEQSKRLLEQAGYPNGIDVELYVSNVDSYMIPLAEVYKQQVAKAGIRVELKQVPSDTYYTDTWMVVPMCGTLWGQKPAEQILNELYRSGSIWNESYWAKPDYDKLLDSARKELDFEKRRKIYQDAQRMLFEEGGVFIPFHLTKTRVYRRTIVGLEPGMEFFPQWYKIKKSE
jgi:peptide/nickel transport system substrate-binding protein